MKNLNENNPIIRRKKGTSNEELASQLAQKVSSTNIKDIRDNVDVFEYSPDGTIWKPIKGGSGTDEYYFGLEKLKKFKTSPSPQTVFFGDSIVDGTGSSGNNSFVEQIKNAVHYHFGLKGNGLVKLVPKTGWTYDGTGIMHTLLTNTGGDVDLSLGIAGRTDLVVDVIYAKKPDGGQFDIIGKKGATERVLATCDSNGVENYNNVQRVEVTQFENILIRPKIGAKVYFNAFVEQWKSFSGGNVFTVSYGGHGLKTYTDRELIDTMEFLSGDLMVIEMGANDYGAIELNEWKRRLELCASKAQAKGFDLLFLVMGNNPTMDAQPAYQEFIKAKQEMAKKYNGAFIDINKFWGNYAGGNANGYYVDTIHPSQKGHNSISFILQNLLFGTYINYDKTRAINNQNINDVQYYLDPMGGGTGFPIYTVDYHNEYRDIIFRKKAIFEDAYVKVNGYQGRVAPILSGNTAQRPAKPIRGLPYFDTDLGKQVVCRTAASVDGSGNVTTPAVWSDNLSEFVSTIPTASAFAGKSGQWTADANYLYVCYATNLWRRVAVSTW